MISQTQLIYNRFLDTIFKFSFKFSTLHAAAPYCASSTSLFSSSVTPTGSLVYLLFCVTRYGWGWDNYKKEVNTGEGLKMKDWMRGYLTYVLPVIVLFIFAFGIYDKFFA